IGIIAGYPAAVDPDDFGNAQAFVEFLRNLLALPTAIAGRRLHAARGRQQPASSVTFDCAALHTHFARFAGDARKLANLGCGGRIAVPRRIFSAPGIELPVDPDRLPAVAYE